MGGAIFVGTSGINREDCKPTLDHFLRNHLHPAGINVYRMIGSTGKKTVSRDADITVEIPRGDSKLVFKERLERVLSTALGSENVRKMGSNIHVKYPIFNLSEAPTGRYVQVDIMPGDDLDHTSWLFAGVDENRIQGAYRNALINLIARKKSDAACTTERKVKYAIAYPGGLQVRVDGNPQTFLMEGREMVRTEDPAKILEVLEIDLHPDQALTFESMVSYMASHPVFRDYLLDFEDYIAPKLKRDPANARKAVAKVNEVLRMTSNRVIREYITRILQEANEKCKKPSGVCFPNMTGAREGVKIGKLAEFSVLDAILGRPRGGGGDLPTPGAFRDTPDTDSLFTDPNLTDDEKKTIFAVYRAAYLAVRKNPIFGEGLGTPLITTIGQDTGEIDVPTDIADIHVKYNEEVSGGRFGNIRKLAAPCPDGYELDEKTETCKSNLTPEDLADLVFNQEGVSGYYSRGLYDEAVEMLFHKHMKGKLTSYLRAPGAGVKQNQIDGRFVRENGTLAKGGFLGSKEQREKLSEILGISKRDEHLLKAAVSEANRYRHHRLKPVGFEVEPGNVLDPEDKQPREPGPKPGDKDYISWKDPGGKYAALKSRLRDIAARMHQDEPLIDQADKLMETIDAVFRKFYVARSAFQEAMKPTYDDLAKLLSGEKVGDLVPPTLSGRPFTRVFSDDIMSAFFDIQSDLYGKVPTPEEMIDTAMGRDAQKESPRSGEGKTIIVCRVCWSCDEEVTVIMEKFGLKEVGGAEGFLSNLDFTWHIDRTTLEADVGPPGKPYFRLKARNDGKATGPQIIGDKGWKQLVSSEVSTATTVEPLEISVDDAPEEVPEEIEEPKDTQPAALPPEAAQPEGEESSESLRRLVRSILREA